MSVLPMRNASMHHLNIAALLLCAATAGCSMFGKKAPATPAADAKPAAAAANANAAPAAAKPLLAAPAAASTNVPIDSIAVIVNDDVITRQELAARVKTVAGRMQAQHVPIPEAADLQEAKEMGVRVDDSMLDRAVGRIAEQQKMTIQQLRDATEKEGTPYAAFREEIRQEIIMQRLREHEVDSKIQISDAEVDSYLAAQKAAAAEQFEDNISQIMVRVPENANAEVIAARRARAEEVMRQLRTGADFAKMAGTYSDASDALKGGEIGWRNPDRLPPMFAEALNKLKPGQVTPIMKSVGAFHILKLVDRRSVAEAQAAAAVQQTHARHILIKVTPTMSAYDAKRKLIELKERLDNKAATFEELARQYGTDSSAAKGGDLGWLYPGDTVPEFEAAMNALQPGQVSEPIETSFGYHLIEVLERKSDDVSKERERNAARNAIRDRKVEEETEAWSRQIRYQAYVEYRADDLK